MVAIADGMLVSTPQLVFVGSSPETATDAVDVLAVVGGKGVAKKFGFVGCQKNDEEQESCCC